MTEDRFDTLGIRERVLASWTASSARFREDANAEEDLVLGGYRDRLVVELAQNAADAAARAGQPGRFRLELIAASGAVDPASRAVLIAANTGVALDAAGVQALATLRASAKRDGDTIGRFGVGFAAVLAVTDDPVVLSQSGGVRFSSAETRGLVEAGAPSALGAELTRRDGQVPVLRLPFAAEGAPPDGYDTAVLLPLRDQDAVHLVERLLDEVDDSLLLALPTLTEIVIERPDRPIRMLRDVGERWHVLRRAGQLAASVLAGRPIEERDRRHWELAWALPRTSAQRGEPSILPEPRVVHAPTPSDEPLPWPALLIATLPLDPSRRHVAPGPVTDALVSSAAQAYVELLVERARDGEQAWPLVVTGLAAGPLDGALRAAVTALLPDAPILQSAATPSTPLRPRAAVALAGPVGADLPTVRAFAAAVAESNQPVGLNELAHLVHAPRSATAVFDLLAVRRISLADAVEALPPMAEPARWGELYTALTPLAADVEVREALALLPVPLADGRVARGMRGLLLAPPGGSAPEVTAALVVLGVRVVHPDAVHPLLERLGAVITGPRALLELPAVRAGVNGLVGEASGDLDSPTDEQVADAVLTLVDSAVRADQLNPGDLPWLGDLGLPDEAGELTPAAALALPGSPAAEWFSADEIGLVAGELVQRWGAKTLAAVGVLDGPALIRLSDVPIEPAGVGIAGIPVDEGPEAELDGWYDWCAMVAQELDGLPPGAVLAELIAVADLDVVRPQALPDVLALIAADPRLRPALVGRARIIADGQTFDVTPYTAWWLREELTSSEGQAGALAGPDADPGLRALLPVAPDWMTGLTPAVQRVLGVLLEVADLDSAAVPGVLERLFDDSVEVPVDFLIRVLARLAVLASDGLEVERPPRVRGIDGHRTRVVAADQALVLEAPMYRQRTDLGVALPAAPQHAAALADLLDLPLAAELVAGEVTEDADPAERQPTPEALRRLLPQVPPTWCEHDELLVDGVEVGWWVSGAGLGATVHAATTDGLARGLAWAAGEWGLRALVAEVLAEPELTLDVMIDQVFSGSGPGAEPAGRD